MKTLHKLVLVIALPAFLLHCKQPNSVECVQACYDTPIAKTIDSEPKKLNVNIRFKLGKEFYPLENVPLADSLIKTFKPEYIDARIYYPYITNAKPRAILYAESRKIITEELSKFKKTIVDNNPDKQSRYYNGHSLFNATPVKLFLSDTLVGIAYEFYIYPVGAVHGFIYYKTINYDLRVGKNIPFNSYFAIKTKQDSTEFINLFNSYLVKNNGELYNEFGELKYLKRKDSIDFLFDNYEVASYAYGASALTISKKELDKFIRKKPIPFR